MSSDDRHGSSWLGSFLWGLVVGAILAWLIWTLLKVLRVTWDYRRELAPLVLVATGWGLAATLASGSGPAASAAIAVVVVGASAAAGVALACRVWRREALQRYRLERFVLRVRRAWPKAAAQAIGGGAAAWRPVSSSFVPPNGIALRTRVAPGFSAADVASRADALAACYTAAGCEAVRDPHRADLVTVSLRWH